MTLTPQIDKEALRKRQSYINWLEADSRRTVFVPAQVNSDGTIDNAVQAYRRITGARSGECNFKKSQRPARKGTFSEGCERGTFVQNLHPEYVIARTREIEIDAQVLRYGVTLAVKRLAARDSAAGWDQIAAISAERAADYLQTQQKKDLAAVEIVQSAAGSTNKLAVCEGLRS
jgi:hypothetical protein